MKKLFLAASITSLMLTACGTYDETVEQNNQQDAEKKDQHKVTRKDGVTYVDGHLFVNKKVGLPSEYAPGENVKARMQLDRMIQESRQDDVNLVFRSGFRSYETQQQLYSSYVAKDGQAAADKYSARPGHSEHQSGLAFDVGSANASDDFKTSFVKTPEGQWVKDHAHTYGFIIRYPEGKEAITGYQYEPWHLRYVGKDLEQTIHNEETTLEEYFEFGQ